MHRLGAHSIPKWAVLARTSIFLALLAVAASCDGATEPDPYAALYGEYQLYLYNGYGLPAQAPPVAGSGLTYEQVSRGSLTLFRDRSYLLIENRYPAQHEGLYEVVGDSVILHDAPWHPRMVHIWSAPDVLTTRHDRRPTSDRLGDSTVYVRTGAEPKESHRYGAYRLIAFEGEPLPITDEDRGIHLYDGYLWLFDAGHYDRLTSDPFMWGYRRAFTVSGSSHLFEDWMGTSYYDPEGAALGRLSADTLHIGPLTYLLLNQ